MAGGPAAEGASSAFAAINADPELVMHAILNSLAGERIIRRESIPLGGRSTVLVTSIHHGDASAKRDVLSLRLHAPGTATPGTVHPPGTVPLQPSGLGVPGDDERGSEHRGGSDGATGNAINIGGKRGVAAGFVGASVWSDAVEAEQLPPAPRRQAAMLGASDDSLPRPPSHGAFFLFLFQICTADAAI